MTAKRRQILKIVDWTEEDAGARYMKAYRVMIGFKKELTPEEFEFKQALKKAQDLVKKL